MVAVGILTTALLYGRIGTVVKITLSLWIGTLLTVAVVIFSGPFHFNPRVAFDFPPNPFNFSLGFFVALGAAARVGIYDYLGYYDVCFIGDEVKEPGRVIPRSIVISLIAVAVIYLAMNLAIIGVVPWREFVPANGQPPPDPPPPIVSMFIERLYGARAASVFTIMVLWTALASCFALMLGYSRIPFAAARDGNFFSIFSRVHATKKFPHISLLFVGGMSILCTWLDLMTVINALLTTRIAVQFIGQIGAVMWLRKTAPDLQRPFRMWLYPLPALVALAGWRFLLRNLGFTDPKTLIYGALLIALGAIVYRLFARRSSQRVQ